MDEVTAQVEDAVRGLISSGDLAPKGKLPSERQLAEELSASRTTIRLILVKLAAEGLIGAEHGRGYFVCNPTEQAK